MEADAQAPRPW